MTQREFLLIGHGSRVPEAIDEFNQFAGALADYIERPAESCFLELSQPEMTAGLANAARRAQVGGEVVVLPMFLGSAFHMKAEVSAALQRTREQFPGTHIVYSTPLGFHIKLAQLLKVRVDEALATTPDARPAAETTVLVVGGGSSDLDSNSSVSKTGRVLFELGDYRGVEVAYQRVTHPTTAEGIQRCHQLGAEQVVVVPYLLFTGIVHQKTVAAADTAASELGMRIIHAGTLGPVHPLLVEVAAQRLSEAGRGVSKLLRENMVEGIAHTQSGQGGHHHHHHGHHEHDHDHDHDHSEHHHHG